MTVVDSSALIAIRRREPEADDFIRIIAETRARAISALSVLGTSMVLSGRSGDDRA